MTSYTPGDTNKTLTASGYHAEAFPFPDYSGNANEYGEIATKSQQVQRECADLYREIRDIHNFFGVEAPEIVYTLDGANKTGKTTVARQLRWLISALKGVPFQKVEFLEEPHSFEVTPAIPDYVQKVYYENGDLLLAPVSTEPHYRDQAVNSPDEMAILDKYGKSKTTALNLRELVKEQIPFGYYCNVNGEIKLFTIDIKQRPNEAALLFALVRHCTQLKYGYEPELFNLSGYTDNPAFFYLYRDLLRDVRYSDMPHRGQRHVVQVRGNLSTYVYQGTSGALTVESLFDSGAIIPHDVVFLITPTETIERARFEDKDAYDIDPVAIQHQKYLRALNTPGNRIAEWLFFVNNDPTGSKNLITDTSLITALIALGVRKGEPGDFEAKISVPLHDIAEQIRQSEDRTSSALYKFKDLSVSAQKMLQAIQALSEVQKLYPNNKVLMHLADAIHTVTTHIRKSERTGVYLSGYDKETGILSLRFGSSEPNAMILKMS